MKSPAWWEDFCEVLDEDPVLAERKILVTVAVVILVLTIASLLFALLAPADARAAARTHARRHAPATVSDSLPRPEPLATTATKATATYVTVTFTLPDRKAARYVGGGRSLPNACGPSPYSLPPHLRAFRVYACPRIGSQENGYNAASWVVPVFRVYERLVTDAQAGKLMTVRIGPGGDWSEFAAGTVLTIWTTTVTVAGFEACTGNGQTIVIP